MKKQFFIALLANAALFFAYCNKADTPPNTPESILARAGTDIQKITGIKQDYTITGVKQVGNDKGVVTLVSYRLKDGTEGNYAVFSGVRYKLNGQTYTAQPNARESYSCTRTGICPCFLLVFYDADEDVYYLTCSCSDCHIKVTYS